MSLSSPPEFISMYVFSEPMVKISKTVMPHVQAPSSTRKKHDTTGGRKAIKAREIVKKTKTKSSFTGVYGLVLYNLPAVLHYRTIGITSRVSYETSPGRLFLNDGQMSKF